MTATVRDNKPLRRFEMTAGADIAVANYRLEHGLITFTHTEVPDSMRGRGVGSQLVRGAFEAARADGLKVAARCSFVSAYIGRHPEFNDLLP
jgi:hypothetical protein